MKSIVPRFRRAAEPAAATGNVKARRDLQPLCNILDLTPEGRGTDWYPKLSY